MNNMLLPPNMFTGQQVQGPLAEPAPPQTFGGPQGMGRMNQLYGLLAQHADNPAAIGEAYARSVQTQQGLEQRASQDEISNRLAQQQLGMDAQQLAFQQRKYNDPIERAMAIFGNVNPYDFEPDSMQRFWENVEKGIWDTSVLVRRKQLSGQLEKAMLDAEQLSVDASNSAIEFENLAKRYTDLYRSGNFSQGAPAAIRQWFIRNISGEYDTEAALMQDMEKFVNQRAIKDLPAGPATDRDLAIARKGYPPPGASPEYWASYLRGMQKAAIVQFAYNYHKQDWYANEKEAKGQLNDWMEKRNKKIKDAWEYHGLSENIIDAKYSDEEAAKILAQRYDMYLPQTTTETYGTTAPEPQRSMLTPRGTRSQPNNGASAGPSPVMLGGKRTPEDWSYEDMRDELNMQRRY